MKLKKIGTVVGMALAIAANADVVSFKETSQGMASI